MTTPIEEVRDVLEKTPGLTSREIRKHIADPVRRRSLSARLKGMLDRGQITRDTKLRYTLTEKKIDRRGSGQRAQRVSRHAPPSLSAVDAINWFLRRPAPSPIGCAISPCEGGTQ